MGVTDNGHTHPAFKRPQHQNIAETANLRYFDGSIFRFYDRDIRVHTFRYFNAETARSTWTPHRRRGFVRTPPFPLRFFLNTGKTITGHSHHDSRGPFTDAVQPRKEQRMGNALIFQDTAQVPDSRILTQYCFKRRQQSSNSPVP